MRVRYLLVVAAVCVAGSAAAITLDTPVADPTKINVLRQYYEPMEMRQSQGMNNVTQFCTGTFRLGAGDGGGWNDEAHENAEVAHTWVFPGARVIGSWNIQMNTAPGTLVIEYLAEPLADPTDPDSGNWVVWNAGNQKFDVKGSYNVTFQETPVSAYGVRYLATSPADDKLRINELQVFLAADQTVTYADGYNILTQGIVKTTYRSPTNDVWESPRGGCSFDTLYNGIVHGDPLGELCNQERARSFVSCELNERTPMSSFTWGGTNGQGWRGNWEIYTFNGDYAGVDPAELGSTIDALTAAGWVLQYHYTDGGAAGGEGMPGFRDASSDFLMYEPGFWQNILIVWDYQHGSMQELEIHASAKLIPEPATMAMLAMGGLALLRRRGR